MASLGRRLRGRRSPPGVQGLRVMAAGTLQEKTDLAVETIATRSGLLDGQPQPTPAAYCRSFRHDALPGADQTWR
ncbi:hypothetical protein ACFWG0_15440 [Streptomyces yangpuensis]|uniref:hypothetical protein n=2 Tax=Streptomyces yangpuensis TaxID=1648182 RepID=UPI00365D200D